MIIFTSEHTADLLGLRQWCSGPLGHHVPFSTCDQNAKLLGHIVTCLVPRILKNLFQVHEVSRNESFGVGTSPLGKRCKRKFANSVPSLIFPLAECC